MSKAGRSTGTATDIGVAVDRTTVVDAERISCEWIRQTPDLVKSLASLADRY